MKDYKFNVSPVKIAPSVSSDTKKQKKPRRPAPPVKDSEKERAEKAHPKEERVSDEKRSSKSRVGYSDELLREKLTWDAALDKSMENPAPQQPLAEPEVVDEPDVLSLLGAAELPVIPEDEREEDIEDDFSPMAESDDVNQESDSDGTAYSFDTPGDRYKSAPRILVTKLDDSDRGDDGTESDENEDDEAEEEEPELQPDSRKGKALKDDHRSFFRRLDFKLAIFAVVFVAICIFVGGIIYTSVAGYTPANYVKSMRELFFDDQTGNYSLIDGVNTAFEALGTRKSTGTVYTSADMSVSSGGEIFDTVFASSLNRWIINGETSTDIDGLSCTTLTIDAGNGTNELASLYSTGDLKAFRLFGGETAYSYTNIVNLMFSDDAESKKLMNDIYSIFGHLDNEAKIFTYGRETLSSCGGQELDCKTLSARATGAQLRAMLTETAQLILDDEAYFTYIDTNTFRDSERTREALQSLKEFSVAFDNDTFEVTLYKYKGNTIAFALKISTYNEAEPDYILQYDKFEGEGGWQRRIILSADENKVTVNSDTSPAIDGVCDAGNIIISRDGAESYFSYELRHIATTSESGLNYSEDTFKLISAPDSKHNISLTVMTMLNQFGEGDNSPSSCDVTYTMDDVTLRIYIESAFVADNTVTVELPEKIETSGDKDGVFSGDTIFGGISGKLSAFWNTKLFEDIYSPAGIPKSVLEKVLYPLFTKPEKLPEGLRITTAPAAGKPIVQPEDEDDAEQTDDEEPHDSMEDKLPDDEEAADEAATDDDSVGSSFSRENRTWEDIQNEQIFPESLWTEFWEYYRSDDGSASGRHSSIIRYFYDFLDEYYPGEY